MHQVAAYSWTFDTSIARISSAGLFSGPAAGYPRSELNQLDHSNGRSRSSIVLCGLERRRAPHIQFRCLFRSSSSRKNCKNGRVASDGNDQAREKAMSYLKVAGFSVVAALTLGLGSGAKAAPLSNSLPAIEASGVSNGLVLKTQTLGMQRRHERRMDRQDRRMDRQVNRQERRMDRHDQRMERRY